MSSQTQTITQLQQLSLSNPAHVGSIDLRASNVPLRRNLSLNKFNSFEVTPFIGQEFDKSLQLSELVNAEDVDKFLQDLASLVSERGVVFFRSQNITVEDQKILGQKLGQLSGKPRSSTLHVHPTTEDSSPKGDQISIITSKRRAAYSKDESKIASRLWHSDITFEPVPSDYAILKVHTNPPSGGDTLWASAYEAYSRLSPEFAKFLEGLSAYHEASFFKDAAKAYGIDLRTGERGSPLNKGEDLSATHPIVRTNPVTGWKGLFVNKGFTRRIIGVNKDESDLILSHLNRVVSDNHDLQVRFKWSTNNPPGIGDVAIWDNRSTFHTATYDYGKELRVGDRVVSIGEKPYFDPASKSRREALGLPIDD